jgi:MFS family permease
MRNKMIILLLAVLLVLNLTHCADQAGDDYFDKALKSAAVTFAVARVLNGIITLVQHVEVAATPAGVGLSVAPGQILDPLNDLIEQFSTVMLLATVSLAIQKRLLAFSGWWAAKIVIAALLSLLLILLILDQFKIARQVNKSVLYKIVLLLLFVRFALPFVAISSSIIEAQFLKEPIQAKTEKLQLVEQFATEAIDTDEVQKWHESLIASGKNLIKVRENAALLKERLSKSISTIIDLIALFIIQTVLLPLAFLYLAVKLVKQLFAYDVSGHLAARD